MMINPENRSISGKIRAASCFAIFGAQVVAYGAYVALKSLFNITPQCFVVSHRDGNPSSIDGICVQTLDSCRLPADTLFIVAVTELLQEEICQALRQRGYDRILQLGACAEHRIMSAYYDSIGKYSQLNGSQTAEKTIDLRVYECHGPKDKALAKPPVLKSWESKFVAGITDADGENIAKKNHMYSEMTAMYWIWKNTTHQYKGIAHYRRHLLLTDRQICELSRGETDAILPLPYLCYPDTLSQLSRFVSNHVINVLVDALKALHPVEYEEYLQILRGKYQYAYNLVIAKRGVFDAYCAWIFPILAHMERSSGRFPELRNTRALSYAAEALTNLYFMSNGDQLTIRHAEKGVYI